jgi:hypothetical protein
MTRETSYELQVLAGQSSGTGNNSIHQDDNDGIEIGADSSNRHEFSLPPADGGRQAWCFLAACFAMEAIIWGEHLHSPYTSPPNQII